MTTLSNPRALTASQFQDWLCLAGKLAASLTQSERSRLAFYAQDGKEKCPNLSDAERLLVKAAEHVADAFWDRSFDDYAAGVITPRSEAGVSAISCATGVSTWDALRNACNGDRDRAGVLAEMRIAENWTTLETWSGTDRVSVQYRTIEDKDGNVTAYLFKR